MDMRMLGGDTFEHPIGLRPRPEENRLKVLAGPREPFERGQPATCVGGRADEVERRQRANAEGPLPEEQTDQPLLLYLAKD